MINAAARAAESRRSDRLFDDPDAARIVDGSPATSLLDELGGAALSDVIAVRARWIDDAIHAVVGEGARTVVLLGSGFDMRSSRLSVPEGTAFIEVDRAAVIRHKRRVVS
jgi:methyltransferase (TIGR00027 family)